jgi:hypothetical protein
MADVHDIDEHLPHMFFEAMCMNCNHRWIAVTRANVLLKKMECPDCKDGVGNVINTGQPMDE